MVHDIDKVLLRPGDAVKFESRDELLETLDRLDEQVPARHEGRTTAQREHFVMLRYLQILAGQDLLPLPVTLRKAIKNQDPPDFVLEWPEGRKESFELTDGSTEEYQRKLSETSATGELVLPVDVNIPEKNAALLWAEILFSAFLRKAMALMVGHFSLDHLIIYDLTGLGLLLPLERGAPILRQKVQEWHARQKPPYCFGRISVLRDWTLLLDIGHGGEILRRESPYYQIPVIRASGEEDLKKRLRNLDHFCRENSIRHLKAFGSFLGDLKNDVRDDSDLDLLVEFEPGTRVTLLDMARMERELGELTGFQIDLRTAGDLSRYFRREILEKAAELDASPG
jgi:uncharacterized protein